MVKRCRRPRTLSSGAGASFILDFLSGSLDSRLTFTRASTATYFNSAGTLTTAAVDAPRFDYDPSTLLPLGLLIEEDRTNSLRNNTMVGAVGSTNPTNWTSTGTLNGITVTISAATSENGIECVDITYSGTATLATNFFINTDADTQIAATSGQSWTGSAYLRKVSGTAPSATFKLATSGRSAAGLELESTTTNLVLTNASLKTQRKSVATTLANALTTNILQYIQLGFANAEVVNLVLRIGLPQLELGSFATSVIKTSTVAVTRSIDICTATLGTWFNPLEGTVVVEGDASLPTGSTRRLCEFASVDFTSRMLVGYSTLTGIRYLTQVASVSQADITVVTPASPPSNRVAFCYKVNDFQIAAARTLGIADTTGTVPTVTSLQLGGENGVAMTTLDGHLSHFIYYPTRLSDNTLQILTS